MKCGRLLNIILILILVLPAWLGSDLFHNHDYLEGCSCHHTAISSIDTCPVFSFALNFSSDLDIPNFGLEYFRQESFTFIPARVLLPSICFKSIESRAPPASA